MKMTLLKGRNILLFCLFCLMAIQKLHANHIVGGDIQMLSRGNDRYLIRVNLYFDNISGGLESIDAQAMVGIFRKSNNQLVETLQVPYRSALRLDYSRPECRSNSNSITRHFYELEVTLLPGFYNDAGGYYMAYERCCRNNRISNIVTPTSIGMVFYLEFPRLDLFRNNSSPEMPPPVSDLICTNRPYTTSFTANDANGDSLVYSLVVPLRGNTSLTPPVPFLSVPVPGPYNSVVWSSNQFSATQPTGNPPVQINSNTGVIRLNPTLAGVFLFTIRVEEFRNGQKIGEVRRDLQWVIGACPISIAPVGVLTLPNDTQPLLENDTVVLGSNRCLQLRAADGSAADRLRARVLSVDGAVPVTITPSSAQATSGPLDTVDFLFCLNNCEAAPGQVLRLQVSVEDNTCPLALADTLGVFVRSEPEPNTPPIFQTSAISDTLKIKAGQQITLNLTVNDSDNDQVFLDIDRNNAVLRSLTPQWQAATAIGSLERSVVLSTNCDLVSPIPYLLRFQYRDSTCYPSQRGTDSLWILVVGPDASSLVFTLPNMISPNGDGLNDTFQFSGSPSGSCDPQFVSISIVNRWGRTVFKSKDRNFAWSAEDVPQGLYFANLQFQNTTFTTSIQVIK